MASIRCNTWSLAQPLSDIWECARAEAGAADSPASLGAIRWVPANVPGTFAVALRDSGEWDGERPLQLDDDDIWYRTKFTGAGDHILHFQGLATIAEVWLNGELLLHSDNMFRSCRVLAKTDAENDLYICFRSLSHWMSRQRGRARWRPRLAYPSSLRFARTTLLGRMPGWCPTVHPVGPWRPILIERRQEATVAAIDVRTAVLDREGRVVIKAVLDLPADVEAVADLDGRKATLQRIGETELRGEIAVADPPLWWPHTHGSPALLPLSLRLNDDVRHDLGAVGFRQITVDRGDDGRGFGLSVNDVPVFCRGACWTSADIVGLPGDKEAYRPWLMAMRDADMNMVRVGGTMVYEADGFYELCDELGLLVWQDAMLANFDYPGTPAFREALDAEVRDFLSRTQTNPSLAVFCGGSEVMQQAAMLGMPTGKIDLSIYNELIPEIVSSERPDLIYVPNSPCGGDWPFQPDAGVAHYYGVGAYLRPLDDARRAGVRFASECLALSNVPDVTLVDSLAIATTTDPRWKRGVPRDPGAGWDFEDVRDHYLKSLFDVDPAQLRWTDSARYLDMSRAVSCVLAENTFAEWRRTGSPCRGGLIWQLQDVLPGAGWGILDVTGRPKPVWYALRRAFGRRALFLTDEGLNGLRIHIVNETDASFTALLQLTCLKDGQHPVRETTQHITLLSREVKCVDSTAILPEFFDITYAYRFGPRVHDVTVATLRDATTMELIAEAVHFPAGPDLPVRDVQLTARVERSGEEWDLLLSAARFGHFVQIRDAGFIPEDNWFHVSPRVERRIRLRSAGSAKAPDGEVTALNMDRVVRYAGQV